MDERSAPLRIFTSCCCAMVSIAAVVTPHRVMAGRLVALPSSAYAAAADPVRAVIDIPSASLVGTIPLSGQCVSLAASPAGDRLYGAVDSSVVVIDTAALAVVATIPTSAASLARLVMGRPGRLYASAINSAVDFIVIDTPLSVLPV